MAKVIVRIADARQDFELGAITTIGRALHNTIVLQDPEVSKEHAVIERDAQRRYMLRDCSSRTGTFIRGERVFKPREVIDGDEIQIGSTTLGFESHETTPVAAATSTRAPASSIDSMIALLDDPTNLGRMTAAVLDLTGATYAELFEAVDQDPRNGLVPRAETRRDHDTTYGPSPAIHDVFRSVRWDRHGTVVADSVLQQGTGGTTSVYSVIVAPMIHKDRVYGVLYAHRPAPFSAADLALCTGIGRLAAISLHMYKELFSSLEQGMHSLVLDHIVPPAFLQRAKEGKLTHSSNFTEVYLLYSGAFGGPASESDALKTATRAGLALSPVERVALGGRLLESAIDADLSDVERLKDEVRSSVRPGS